MMAHDVLAVPATIVASESTISIGGSFINEKYACLLPNIVEILLITDDWTESGRASKYNQDLFFTIFMHFL